MTPHILKAVLIRAFLALGLLAGTRVEAAFAPSAEVPPTPPREFRGAWVATVNNIDWPSRPGLSVSQQQQELLNLLDQAASLRLNSILFQVRPACDALYESKLEPWSEYLSGTMGQPPQPYYDPLAFIIREAHQRGLELHAWFNPFRARHHSGQGPLSPRHIARTKPQWVRSYGKYLWLDPAEPGVADYSLRVILDVVKRYDIDGVHLDDYFYPYREKDSKGRPLDFPDSPAWKRYQAQGGKLSRADWRRNHVNTFVKRLYDAVKAEKPHVKLGISPFGIWRPGYPASVDGLDSYEELFADSKKWWNQGWVDYLAPQLYWSIDAKQQSFPALLRWWTEQNTQRPTPLAWPQHRQCRHPLSILRNPKTDQPHPRRQRRGWRDPLEHQGAPTEPPEPRGSTQVRTLYAQSPGSQLSLARSHSSNQTESFSRHEQPGRPRADLGFHRTEAHQQMARTS
jgi:uncharacterized lipoprotein YddW (UPF0748 family)